MQFYLAAPFMIPLLYPAFNIVNPSEAILSETIPLEQKRWGRVFFFFTEIPPGKVYFTENPF